MSGPRSPRNDEAKNRSHTKPRRAQRKADCRPQTAAKTKNRIALGLSTFALGGNKEAKEAMNRESRLVGTRMDANPDMSVLVQSQGLIRVD